MADPKENEVARDTSVNPEPAVEMDARSQQITAQRKRMAEIAKAAALQRVRVTAANEDIARVMRHPNGNRFPKDGGSVEWPLDQFTRRRIKEGSVTRDTSRDEQKDADILPDRYTKPDQRRAGEGRRRSDTPPPPTTA